VGPRAGLDAVERRQISFPAGNRIPVPRSSLCRLSYSRSPVVFDMWPNILPIGSWLSVGDPADDLRWQVTMVFFAGWPHADPLESRMWLEWWPCDLPWREGNAEWQRQMFGFDPKAWRLHRERGACTRGQWVSVDPDWSLQSIVWGSEEKRSCCLRRKLEYIPSRCLWQLCWWRLHVSVNVTTLPVAKLCSVGW
jgi:hypothetical protein